MYVRNSLLVKKTTNNYVNTVLVKMFNELDLIYSTVFDTTVIQKPLNNYF